MKFFEYYHPAVSRSHIVWNEQILTGVYCRSGFNIKVIMDTIDGLYKIVDHPTEPICKECNNHYKHLHGHFIITDKIKIGL